MAKTIYLDYAAATPLDERVFAAMEPYFSEQFYNPASPYLAAKKVREAITQAKTDIALILGAKPNDFVFTAGATESVNLAIKGIMANYPKCHIVSSQIEHQAVLRCVENFNHTLTKPKASGVVDLAAIESAITDKTVLISIGYVNSELGTIQPLNKIAKIISKIRLRRLAGGNTLPLYFHTDASQAAGHLPLKVSRLGVDLMSLSAAKCYGPKQVGGLWINAGINLSPIINGGGQERGLRSGTENTAGVIGFSKALTLAEQSREAENERLKTLRDQFETIVLKRIPQTLITNSAAPRLTSVSHLAWPGVDAERVLIELDLEGIMVATGSACAANKGTRSHVLTAIGLDETIADGSLRISLGKFTTPDDIKVVTSALERSVKKELSK